MPSACSRAPEAASALRGLLADPAASFAIGVPAAVAEFMRRPDEPCVIADRGFALSTPRGGIHLQPVAGLRPVAYEAPSRHAGRWLQGLVFCLPEAEARLGARRRLSALGPDEAALREEDRAAELFDLGVGAAQVDFCVRTGDAGLCARLRDHCGLALAEWPPDLMAALVAAGPQRVVRSCLGRIEVAGPIPHERTPLGPHTHLFPDRLAAAAQSDPGLPLPAGWLPVLQAYPPHPQVDLAGDAIAFDMARHRAFQALLMAWGDADYLAAKAQAEAALKAGNRDGRAEPSVERGWERGRDDSGDDGADDGRQGGGQGGNGPAWEVARRQATALRGAGAVDPDG